MAGLNLNQGTDMIEGALVSFSLATAGGRVAISDETVPEPSTE